MKNADTDTKKKYADTTKVDGVNLGKTATTYIEKQQRQNKNTKRVKQCQRSGKNVGISIEEDANSEDNADTYTRWKNAKTTWKADATWGGTARKSIGQRKKERWILKKKRKRRKTKKEKQ